MHKHGYRLIGLAILSIVQPICAQAQEVKVTYPVGRGETPLPLGELMRRDAEEPRRAPRVNPPAYRLTLPPPQRDRKDPAVQEEYGTVPVKVQTLASFEGQSNWENQTNGDGPVAPPDMIIAVGNDHIVQGS